MSKRFSAVYFLSYLLDAPLFALYGMLLFVLTKELHINGLQITLFVSLKPLMALASSYWNEMTKGRAIERNLCSLVVIACLPALALPFVDSAWFAIAAFATYFFADRAAIAGWMELVKTKIPSKDRGWTVSRASLIMFLAGAFVPLIASPWMIHWRWLYFGLAIVSLLRLMILFPLARSLTSAPPVKRRGTPIKETISILRSRPDFAFFQLIFMFGGVGLMVMQPIMPKFVDQLLHLSYTDLALAFAFSKGIGYALSAKLWARLVKQMNMYLLCSLVAALAALSLALIPFSLTYLPMLHVALFIYGVMQAGSQLGWQLSGPHFAGDQNSTSYTGINILAVGLRGCFAPTLGACLGLAFGLTPTLFIGATLCLLGSLSGLIGHQIWGKAPHQIDTMSI